MRCDEIGTLLEAFVDGELTADETEAVETHCRDCEVCGRVLAERRVLRKLARASLRVDLPRDLRQQILDAAAGKETAPESGRKVPAPVARFPFARPQYWVPAVGLAAVLAFILLGDRGPEPRDPSDPFARPATVLPYRQGEAAAPASELEAGTLSLPGSMI